MKLSAANRCDGFVKVQQILKESLEEFGGKSRVGSWGRGRGKLSKGKTGGLREDILGGRGWPEALCNPGVQKTKD